MELQFQLVRDNAYSKLKKAIRRNDPEKMVLSMLHLKLEDGQKGTRGEFVRSETMRALRHLKNMHQGKTPTSVLRALEVAKEKMGVLWDQVAPPKPEKTKKPVAPVSAPNGN